MLVAVEKFEYKSVNLVRELFVNEMTTFGQGFDFKIWYIFLDLPTLYVFLHSWEL